jgi:hypothetical protein
MFYILDMEPYVYLLCAKPTHVQQKSQTFGKEYGTTSGGIGNTTMENTCTSWEHHEGC